MLQRSWNVGHCKGKTPQPLQKSTELKDLKKNVNITPFSRFLWGYKKWAVDSKGRYIVRGPNQMKPRVRCCPREVVCSHLIWTIRGSIPGSGKRYFFSSQRPNQLRIDPDCYMCILSTRYCISFGARH